MNCNECGKEYLPGGNKKYCNKCVKFMRQNKNIQFSHKTEPTIVNRVKAGWHWYKNKCKEVFKKYET